jgi:hypothetical protein
VLDPAVRRYVLDPEVPPAKQAPEAARVDDGSGDEVRADALPLLEHGNRHLAEALGGLGRVLQQLAEPDRAREPRRAGADDQHADVDALFRRIARSGDELVGVERR